MGVNQSTPSSTTMAPSMSPPTYPNMVRPPIASGGGGGGGGVEPNPPDWPDSVKIVRPEDSYQDIMAKILPTQDTWSEEYQSFISDKHFSSERHAVMFAPGVYHGIDLEVGYYTQVLGLGRTSDDVFFTDCERGIFVPALNFHLHGAGTCLDSFWRAAENFASQAINGMQWAVSQAAPLRRVHVYGDLKLHDGAAFSSGGHLANSIVEGMTQDGAQQQWLHRNVQFGGAVDGGAWSMVFAGCTGAVPAPFPGEGYNKAITVVASPSMRMEKPYIALQDDGQKYELRVPPVQTGDATVGAALDGATDEVRDFTAVRTILPDDDTARIQEALDAGLDVLLTPGIYQLKETIQLRQPNQVLLGLGLATLEAPPNGSPCIHVQSGVPGVRVAGIMLEASERTQEATGHTSLFEWGEEGVRDAGDGGNPGALFDVFCRVGGSTLGNRTNIYLDSMMRLHSGNLYGDNLWIWRADHAELQPGEQPNYPEISPIYYQSEETDFHVQTGFEVYGDDVTIMGLAVEHANGHQTIWAGERGHVTFYQSELSYDVSQESFGDLGYLGYWVQDNVTAHELYAPGVYSNFRNGVVYVATAMQFPEGAADITVENAFTVFLDNNFGIQSVANGLGGPADTQGYPSRLASLY